MNAEHRPSLGAPKPVSTGTASYYLDRLQDFQRRCPTLTPPSYYAEYGNKCLGQFLASKPSLSPRGQRWIDETLALLQEMMEQERRRDEDGFAELERDDEAFRDFAFGTHSRAYQETGVFDLDVSDLWRIARTPDLSDLLSDDGAKEIVQLVLGRDNASQIDRTLDLESVGGGALARVARSTRRLRSSVRRRV